MQRMTKQRTAVFEELHRHDGFRSAQQVHEDLQKAGQRVGLATVYRNLQALAESSRIDTLRSEGGEILYRRCVDQAHHHHLVCRSCGYVQEIAPTAVEDWVGEVAREHSFTGVTHAIEIYGTCPNCQVETQLKS